MLTKIYIKNFRCFENYALTFEPGLNILVGDNDTGKSTLLEATALALTGRVAGRSIAAELSPYLFNASTVATYCERLRARDEVAPPEIMIELFMEESESTVKLRGTNNSTGENAPGLRIHVHPDPDLGAEFLEFISNPTDLKLLPVEYYKVDWLAFSGNAIAARGVPATVSLIDAATIRLQSGADYYLQQIISNTLDKAERAELSREYRSLREAFATQDSVIAVNDRLTDSHGDISNRSVSLSIDVSQRFTWEASLAPHLDELPLHLVGRGEQSTLKVLLALSRQVDDTHVILVEEPENHLSFSSLNILIEKIQEKCEGKQVIIATHSSFVLNKLGLRSLILMSGQRNYRITDLDTGSEDYFRKLPGYDTLRLVLARKVVLVEGPSDELVFQRAYLDRFGRLPIQDGVDVLSARGLSFKRFLNLAVPLKRQTVVVRDNDGKDPTEVLEGYSVYLIYGFISIRVGHDATAKTLEPQLLAANGRESLNALFDKDFATDSDLLNYMSENKTTCALKVFTSESDITMPAYVQEALEDLA